MWQRGLEGSGVFYSNANPVHEGSVLMTLHLPRAHLQIPPPNGVRAHHITGVGVGAHKHFPVLRAAFTFQGSASLEQALGGLACLQGTCWALALRKPGKVTPFRRVKGPLCTPLFNLLELSPTPSNTWNSIYLLLASSFLLFSHRKEANFRATKL